MEMDPYIVLQSGGEFNFVDLHLSDFTVEDIARALSRLCSYVGHCNKFYSVAQHSVLVSSILPPNLKRQGLFHDAAEAFIGDMPSPLKVLCPDYKAIEEKVENFIFPYLGLPLELHPQVKIADLILLYNERRDIMPNTLKEWKCLEGMGGCTYVNVTPWNEETAYVAFMEAYLELAKWERYGKSS